MSSITDLETKLDDIINKEVPQLPSGIRKFIFELSPWLALFVGVASMLSAFSLWHVARGVSPSAYYIKQVCSSYQGTGQCTVPGTASHLSFWLWLSIIFMVVQGIFYLRAFPRLREHSKAGWDFLYYATLTYVAYAVITLLTSYDVAGHFIGALIGIAVSFYLLFQIRPLFMGPVISEPGLIDASPAGVNQSPVSKRKARLKKPAA